MTARAQTETLGFVLVFAIVVSTIGVVYATGFSGLQAAKDAEQLQNMERAFDVLEDNMADLSRHGAPSRATEIKLAGGSLAFGNPIRISINATNTSDHDDNASFSIEPQPLVYADQDNTSRIVYTGGAVLRESDQSSVMLSGPPFHDDTHWAVLPLLLHYHSGGAASISGDTTVLVVANRFGGALEGDFNTSAGADVRIRITVESPRADAWKGHFEDEGYTAVDADAGDDEVTYQFTTDRVLVPQTTIELEIEP